SLWVLDGPAARTAASRRRSGASRPAGGRPARSRLARRRSAASASGHPLEFGAGRFVGGEGTAVHALPFQCSIRLCWLAPSPRPTAHTLLAVTTARPCSRVSSPLGRGAEGTIAQPPLVRCRTS